MADCRLYLIVPPSPPMTEEALAAALDAGDCACVLFRPGADPDDALKRTITKMAAIVQQRDVAFLIEDRPDLAAETNCDGIHLSSEAVGYVKARAGVGKNAIVGIDCHQSRHRAMLAAEAGADYVAFTPHEDDDPESGTEPISDLVGWWSEIMEVPCVAAGAASLAEAAAWAGAGADFVAVSAPIWDHPEGPAAAVGELLRMIESA